MGRGAGDKQPLAVGRRQAERPAAFEALRANLNFEDEMARPQPLEGEVVSLIKTDDGTWTVLSISDENNEVRRVLLETPDAADQPQVKADYINLVSRRGQELAAQRA